MTLQEQLERKRSRLNNYYLQEERILSGGVQAYGIGPRNLQRYQTALSEVKNTIKELESEIEILERKTIGRSANRSFKVVPMD